MRHYLAALTALTLLILPFPTALSRIDVPQVPQRTTIIGYDRTAFGPGWAPVLAGAPAGSALAGSALAPRAQCDTRTRVMADAFGADCAAPWPSWQVEPIPDPYTGRPILPADVQIDHILPVSAAWDLGAHRWDDATRARFYNDPGNLVAVSADANQAKSDKLPSEWMPEARRARCAYGRRMVDVATQYALPLPAADVRAIKRACSGVAGLVSRRELGGISHVPVM